MVRIGLLGCGFVATFYMQGLSEVPGQEVVAVYRRDTAKANAFADRWGIPVVSDDMAAVCGRADVDMLLIALPNNMHLEAVRLAAAHGKHVVCTKPLGRNAAEARRMLEAVRAAGVLHGYAETEVFSPAVIRAKNLIDEGAIGRVLTVRSREAHAGPHAPHFWDAAEAGGGALLDMGCHTIEAARYFIGKEVRPVEVLAWGDTLVHKDKTTAEDNAVVLLRFENGALGQSELSWTARGSLDLRNEVFGSEGSVFTDVTRDADQRLRARDGELPAGEGRVGQRVGFSAARRSPRLRLPRGDETLRGVCGPWGNAARNVRGRACRQHHHRRRLSIDARASLGPCYDAAIVVTPTLARR